MKKEKSRTKRNRKVFTVHAEEVDENVFLKFL